MNVLVLGDIILDSYDYIIDIREVDDQEYNKAHVKSTEYFLGGAANVAANMAKLGNNVFVVGGIGEDVNGSFIVKMFNNLNIKYSEQNFVKNIETIHKKRYIYNDKCIMRIDYENINLYEGIESEKYIDIILDLICSIKFDAVVISDYLKGVCSKDLCKFLIEKCRDTNIPVFVDTKSIYLETFRGAYMIKPNMREFTNMVNYCFGMEKKNLSVKEIIELSRKIIKEYNIEKILVTRDINGMLYIDLENYQHIGAFVKTPVNVTGAGDTVLSTFVTYDIEKYYSIYEILELSSCAAAVSVSNSKIHAITKEEIHSFLDNMIKKLEMIDNR